MMDIVTVAMAVTLPLLSASVHLAHKRHRYGPHKKIQLSLALVLLVTVILFEIDVRLHGWQDAALTSPYAGTWLFPLLYVHLAIAVTTTLLWLATIVHALRKIPEPPRPSSASAWHRRLGWGAALGMYATAATGWTFYYAAFVAT